MAIPDFENHPGLDEPILPPGVHPVSVTEIEAVFVEQFDGSATRRAIFEGWIVLRGMLRDRMEVAREFLDGSFVTAREDPSDLDLSIWVDADHLAGLAPHDQAIVSFVFGRKTHDDVKRMFRCDPYLVPECQPNHPSYPAFQQMLWTEGHWASYKDQQRVIRAGVEKGYLEVIDS